MTVRPWRGTQLHSLGDPTDDRASARLGNAPYDGLAQVWYADRQDLEARMATTAGREAVNLLRNDELRFIDRRNSPRWWGLERRIV